MDKDEITKRQDQIKALSIFDKIERLEQTYLFEQICKGDQHSLDKMRLVLSSLVNLGYIDMESNTIAWKVNGKTKEHLEELKSKKKND
jgi:hypothetical protein